MVRRSQGFLLLDVVIGLSVMVILFVALAITTHGQREAVGRLHDQQAALFKAEHVLHQLQIGTPEAIKTDGSQIQLQVLAPIASTETRSWVEVTVEQDGQKASLTGTVPRRHLASPSLNEIPNLKVAP